MSIGVVMAALKKKLGARIQEIRKSKGITQERLAEKIGLDTPNLSNIERGKRFMSAETLEKIVDALGVTEKDLFDFGHIKTREELLDAIQAALNNATDTELSHYYRSIKLYKETT